jgi:hypothetical protein
MSSTTLHTLRYMLNIRAAILTLTMAAFVPVLFPQPCRAAPRRAVGNQVPTPVANGSVRAIGRLSRLNAPGGCDWIALERQPGVAGLHR